ncbi:MAG: YigZ family protein [Gammaproteobacteria bacterium]|nr:YigZ family protein [Gammaproteobacteria bacterium]
MPETTRYSVPAKAIEVVTEIKRSRFIAHIAHCSNTEEAFSVIEQAKKHYPDARHHCWAFIACPPLSSSAVRFCDDGEPSGTAGRPILNVLQHSHYGEIVCVVSRYFGGIKLGAGGLVRAYNNSTQAALEKLVIKEVVELSTIQIQFSYAFESSIRHYLESMNIMLHHVDYQELIIFHLNIEKILIPQMMQQVSNLCKGNVLLINPESLNEN